MYELEHLAGFQEATLVLAHQVLLNLDACRDAPAVPCNQPEHVAETLHYKGVILAASVGQSYPTLAHHVVGVVCVYVLIPLHAARQVHVVHRYLAQRPFAAVAVHVRHLLVHEFGIAAQGVLHKQLVAWFVQDVADGAFAEFFRLPVLVGKVVRVEYLAGFQVPGLKLAAHKLYVHLMNVASVWLVGQHSQA